MNHSEKSSIRMLLINAKTPRAHIAAQSPIRTKDKTTWVHLDLSGLCTALTAPVFTVDISAPPAGAPVVAAPGLAQSGSPYATIFYNCVLRYTCSYSYRLI
mmetsp:Transcript_12682/g.16086  ORF Transcript_12682/g.16086 Transcript_12682/m.16086 type:complete len:101 (+) Transcript_12682:467-769(+)